MSRATALANRFDGEVIEKLHDALTAMDFVGGQLAIQAYRVKYDADGELIPGENHKDTPGQWHTEAFVFSYETRPFEVKPLTPTDAPLEQIDTKARSVVQIPIEGPEPAEAEEVAA
jgi:hypothetical protein